MPLQETLKLLNDNQIANLNLSFSDENRSDDKHKFISKLAGALQQNTSLTSFNLRGYNMKDEGISILYEALYYNTSLTRLSLPSNKISVLGAQALAAALKSNTALKLTSLDLSCNEIGPAGAQALAVALRHNTVLTSLNIDSNQVQDSGAQALAVALQHNTALSCLDIKYNKIGVSGAQALAVVLQQNSMLTSLDMLYNDIGIGAQALANALRDNKTLTYINFSSSKIGNIEVARALVDAFQYNTAIISFNDEILKVECSEQYTLYEARKAHQIRRDTLIKEAASGNQTFLMTFVKEHNNFPPDILGLLIQYGHEDLVFLWQATWTAASFIFKGENKNTPLHFAIRNKNKSLIAWLLTQPAVSLNTVNVLGYSPLMLLKNHPELLPEGYQIENNRLIKPEITIIEEPSIPKLESIVLEGILRNLVNNETIILKLNDVWLDIPQLTALSEALAQNNSLEVLQLENVTLQPESLQLLINSLKRHPSLQRLSLDDNPLGEEGVQAIIKLFKQHATLYKVECGGGTNATRAQRKILKQLNEKFKIRKKYVLPDEEGASTSNFNDNSILIEQMEMQKRVIEDLIARVESLENEANNLTAEIKDLQENKNPPKENWSFKSFF